VSSNDSTDRREGQAYVPILIFVIMAVGIILSGYYYYLNYKKHFRASVEIQLSSIAESKVGELAMWRRERLGDGAVLFKNEVFSALIRRYLEKPEDADAQRKLQAWLGKYITAYQYMRISLFDSQGIQRMSVPNTSDRPDLFVTHNGAEILRGGKVIFQDFHVDAPDLPIHLAVLVPIYDETDASRSLGVLAMDIDPTIYLYPFLIKWPTPSQSGETLLVRRDGNDALMLNQIRFRKNTALNLRIPLTETDRPAVLAALGETGIFEGVQYLGEPVIAAIDHVPDSPWYLAARINTSEVYAPVKERLWLMIALVGVLIVSAGVAMSLVWRQRSLRFYREQLKATEVFRRSESLLSSTQHLAKIGGWEYDVETRTTFWTDEVYYIHEIDPGNVAQGSDEHIARSVECYEPDDRLALLAAFERCVKEGAPYDMEFPFTTAKGRKLWIRAMGHPQVGLNGKIASVIGNIMDITERKQAEAELRLAKEQAEAATKLKDKFVELVAHDLRSPFTSMMGLFRLFGERKSLLVNEDDKKILDRVFKSADRMIAMIDQLLNISRLQTGQITPQPRFFKGHIAAAVTIGALAHNAAQKGIVIINDVPVDMRLYADPSLFDEVLLNLLSNAIKFCSKGDSITFFAPPGLGSAIAIRDTGKGIDEKKIPDLFKHEVTTTTPGTAGEMGTGLGLPFSHDIMEAHGGELTVESSPGKGSVFCAILPHVTPLALVVDDDPDMQLLARIHLAKIGIDVMEAVNGEMALSAMKDRLPHIIITDIMMPVMDGFTLLGNLKKESATSAIPVIVITSADREVRDKAFRLGADDFVSKPIEVDDFIPRVRRFVG
jgi:signal transduction histidine kinase